MIPRGDTPTATSAKVDDQWVEDLPGLVFKVWVVFALVGLSDWVVGCSGPLPAGGEWGCGEWGCGRWPPDEAAQRGASSRRRLGLRRSRLLRPSPAPHAPSGWARLGGGSADGCVRLRAQLRTVAGLPRLGPVYAPSRHLHGREFRSRQGQVSQVGANAQPQGSAVRRADLRRTVGAGRLSVCGHGQVACRPRSEGAGLRGQRRVAIALGTPRPTSVRTAMRT